MLPLSILLPGIAIAAAVAVAGVQTMRLSSCQAEVAAAQQTIGALGADLKAQNAAVESLRSEAIRKQLQAAQALAKAEARAKTWDDQARRLADALTARKPDGPQDCASAWRELRGGK